MSLIFGGRAYAADMAVKAPLPAPAPVYSWTGWYVGLNAGYTWNRNTIETTAIDGCTNLAACPLGVGALSTGLTASFYNISASQHGFIGGGQAGYNYQMGVYLAGLEADIQGIAAKTAGGNIFNSVPFGAAHQNVSASSSLRSTMGFRIRRSRSLITPEEASPSELKKTPSKVA